LAKVNPKNYIIQTKAPLRVSFAGGGTELPLYYKKYGGKVINSTINLFVHTLIKKNKVKKLKINLGDFNISKSFNLNSLKTSHKLFRIHVGVYKKIMKKYNKNILLPIEISSFSDAPVGSGLGSSSTLTVALIKGICGYLNVNLSKSAVAKLAFEIERIDLNLQGGLQDHYSASYGGLNHLDFKKNGAVKINKVKINKLLLSNLESSMMLIHSNITRNSSTVIQQKLNDLKNKDDHFLNYLHFAKKNVSEQLKLFKKNNFSELIKIINESWDKKNKQIPKSNAKLKKLILNLKKIGVHCCKLSGAGNGGFIFAIYDIYKYKKIIEFLKSKKKIYVLKFSFYNEGAVSQKIKINYNL
jgi:D-glycero-alpha-D-manno-heptose-7-phosphate kinase